MKQKIITIQDISIKEFILSEQEDGYAVSISYSLVDKDGKEWKTKRIAIKDFTTTQKKDIDKVLAFIKIKVKSKEEI